MAAALQELENNCPSIKEFILESRTKMPLKKSKSFSSVLEGLDLFMDRISGARGQLRLWHRLRMRLSITFPFSCILSTFVADKIVDIL